MIWVACAQTEFVHHVGVGSEYLSFSGLDFTGVGGSFDAEFVEYFAFILAVRWIIQTVFETVVPVIRVDGTLESMQADLAGSATLMDLFLMTDKITLGLGRIGLGLATARVDAFLWPPSISIPDGSLDH